MNKDTTPIPQGKYVPANRWGDLIFSAGMTPRIKGVLQFKGQVTCSSTPADHRDAVQIATQNAFIAVNNLLQENEYIAKAISLTVYVNAEHGYTQHSSIADFASDWLYEQLGDRSAVSRAAIGVASLPGDAPIEVQLTVAAAKN